MYFMLIPNILHIHLIRAMKIHVDCAIIFLNKNLILGNFFIELFTVIFIEVYMFDKT